MKVEFIIDKNEYEKLLGKDIFGEQIKCRNEKIKGKDNYLLTLECEGKTVSAARTLSENRVQVEKLFTDNNVKYRLLTEEASCFFVQRLYPYACNFETKLRKFIYTALFDIDEKAEKLATEKYKITMSKKGDDKNSDRLPQNDFLTYSNLGQILDFLFDNNDFLDQVKKINTQSDTDIYNRRLTKKELVQKIEAIDEKTIWNLLFAPVFADSKLPKIYSDIQHYRNDIMHLHYISYQEYAKTMKTYISGIKDLDYQLSKGIVIEDTKINVDTLAGSFGFLRQGLYNAQFVQDSIPEALKRLTPSYLYAAQALAASLSPHVEPYAGLLSSVISPTSVFMTQFPATSELYQGIDIASKLNESGQLMGERLRHGSIDIQGDKENGE